jgi:epoxyqueuosine reductase
MARSLGSPDEVMGVRLGGMGESYGDGGEKAESCLSRKVVREFALEAGFSEAGLVALPYADEGRDAERFEEWVRAGRAGTMGYLKRTGEDGRLLRARVGNAFPWARSAVVCFANYESAQPRSTEAAEEGAGWIARYAWSGRCDANGVQRPSDYHKVLRKRINALEENGFEGRGWSEGLGEFEARGFVDTGPVVERALATAAGVGWTGKNTCLIHPRLGSFGFLAVLLTSLPSQQDEKVPAAPAGPVRELQAVPGGLPDGGVDGALPDGCGAVHLVFDH